MHNNKLRASGLVLAALCLNALGYTQQAGDEASRGTAGQARHYNVGVSDQLSTDAHVKAKLTPGQKKAIAAAKDLPAGTAAIFNPDGTIQHKGPAKEVEGAVKSCKDLRQISDKCWLCKDNGEIICGTSTTSHPVSPAQHTKPE